VAYPVIKSDKKAAKRTQMMTNLMIFFVFAFHVQMIAMVKGLAENLMMKLKTAEVQTPPLLLHGSLSLSLSLTGFTFHYSLSLYLSISLSLSLSLSLNGFTLHCSLSVFLSLSLYTALHSIAPFLSLSLNGFTSRYKHPLLMALG
jgi:hypothetical protein